VQQSEPSDFRCLHRIDLGSSGADFEREAYVEPLQLDGETVGGLIIFPRQRDLDDLDVLIAMEVKFALSAQLMRTHVRQQSKDLLLTELFARLFDGDWPDARQIVNRAARLGIDLSRPAVLLGIVVDGTQQASKTDPGQLLRPVRRWLQTSSPGAVVVNHAATLIVYLPNLANDLDTLSATVVRQLFDIVKWHCEAAPIIAISQVCTKLEDYHSAREQCARLVALARIFGRHGVVRQSDFGPFAVLMSALDHSVASDFVETTLGQLEAHDRDGGTELLRTVATFIDQGCRYQATAESLDIHVSTLRYRLQRLHKLFGLDADDPETRFALSLALRLRSVLGPRTP
jgi:purine catabolism regulator